MAADILETPANKLATDTSGDVELVSAEQSELAAAAAISPPSAATIAAQTAAAILETPANKLATDGSGDVSSSPPSRPSWRSPAPIMARAVGRRRRKSRAWNFPMRPFTAPMQPIAVVDQLQTR